VEWLGLRITPPPAAPRVYLGVTTRAENGKTIVTGIRRGSPAANAGMSLLDEIVAVNGEPLPAGELSKRLERLSPGVKVTVSIARRDGIRTMEIVLATDPGHGWQLRVSPGATRTQAQHLDAWLQ
jgi:predicted metalloprotease with PDZ domain